MASPALGGDPSSGIGLLIESDGPGGAEQVVASLAERARTRGARVVLFIPAAGEGWLSRRLDGSGVEVESLPLGGPASIRGMIALAAALDRRRIGLLHTHEFGQSVAGACAARIRRIPHLITMHGGGYYAERARRRAALRLAVSLSAGITAVSAPLAEALASDLRLAPGAVAVVPNGVRPAPGPVVDRRPEMGVPPDVPLLLAVGNLYPVKGHRHLLTALDLLRGRRPHLHLAIAGRGDAAAALHEQARVTGLAERVHFLGLREDVGSLLHSADIFVHPSLAEGLPLAVLEAMHAARPIIASTVGAIPAALDYGAAGRLVPPGDPQALAAASDELLTGRAYARRLARCAEDRAAREYTVEAMAGRYDVIYERLRSRAAFP